MKTILPIFAALLLIHTLPAEVIYSDNFEGATGTKLNTRGPDQTNTPGAKYVGGDAPRLLGNRGVTVGTSVISLPMPTISQGAIVRFEIDLEPKGDNPFGYIGIEFTETSDIPLTKGGVLWVNLMNGGAGRVWSGPSEPKGAGTPLYIAKTNVAAPSGPTRVAFSFNTGTNQLDVSMAGSTIFSETVPPVPADKLKFLTIHFNDVNTSSIPQPACIDNLSVSIDPAG